MSDLFIGLDVGTSGVRALACDVRGTVVASARASLPASSAPQAGWAEQSAKDWWAACCEALGALSASLGPRAMAVRALAVDGTSGTVLPVDAQGRALRPAIMYNDQRAQDEAQAINDVAGDLCARLGYRFNASFGLPKTLWLARHEPRVVEQAHCFVHAADYVAGQLSGCHGTTDTSNALKSGYDLLEHRWPDCLGALADLPQDKLPRVVCSGEPLGVLQPDVATMLGLPPKTVVVAGATDGTAGALACGLAQPGDAATTLGSTMVIKAVSTQITLDPLGRVYSHIHPAGGWLPGGASNTGCAALNARFGRDRLAELDAQAARRLPVDPLVYPLAQPGERFPFVDAAFQPTMRGTPVDEVEAYAAWLQGVGFVERWCYELLKELGCPVGAVVYTTGGGSRSPIWTQLRASILNREIRTAAGAESALGAAMLAATPVAFGGDVGGAVRSMVRFGAQCIPNPVQAARFQERYQAFRTMLA